MMYKKFDDIYQMVKLIPYGKIATYGQIARLVGRPRNAREVGYALSALRRDQTDAMQVPWHRVVNSKGEVSSRANPDYERYQSILLEDEGVEIGLKGRIPMREYQWDETSIAKNN